MKRMCSLLTCALEKLLKDVTAWPFCVVRMAAGELPAPSLKQISLCA